MTFFCHTVLPGDKRKESFMKSTNCADFRKDNGLPKAGKERNMEALPLKIMNGHGLVDFVLGVIV